MASSAAKAAAVVEKSPPGKNPRILPPRSRLTDSLRRTRKDSPHEMAFSAKGQITDLHATLRKNGIVMTKVKSKSKAFSPEDVEASFFAAIKSAIYNSFERRLETTQVNDAWSLLADEMARGVILSKKERLSEEELKAFCRTVDIFVKYLQEAPEFVSHMEVVITTLQKASFTVQDQSSPEELWMYARQAIPNKLSEQGHAVVEAVLQRILSVLLFDPQLTINTIKLYDAYGVEPAVHVRAIMTAVVSACPNAVFHEIKAKLAAKEPRLTEQETKTLQSCVNDLQKQRPQTAEYDSALSVNVIYAETASRPIHQPYFRVSVKYTDSSKRKCLPKHRNTTKIDCDSAEMIWNETVSFLLQTGELPKVGDDCKMNVTVTLYETAVKDKALGSATITISKDDPVVTHGNEQWKRVKVPLLPKSSHDGGDTSCISSFVLVELCLLRFYKVPEADLYSYRILVRKLSDCDSEMMHKMISPTEEGGRTSPTVACFSYPLFSPIAQRLAQQYVNRYGILHKATIALLNEICERLNHEQPSTFILQNTEKQLSAVITSQSRFNEAEMKYRDQVFFNLRTQTDEWVKHFFLLYVDVPEVERALRLWAAVQRATENRNLAGTLAHLCEKAAELCLNLEGASCLQCNVDVANYVSIVDRLLDTLERYARKYYSAFIKYKVDLMKIFCRVYMDFFRVSDEKNIIKCIENSVKTKHTEDTIKLLSKLNALSAAALEAYSVSGAKDTIPAPDEKIDPLPVCRWFDGFFEEIICTTYLNSYNQTRTQSLLQDSWKPQNGMEENHSSSVTDLFSELRTATDLFKGEFSEQFCEDKSVVTPFMQKVWKSHVKAVCNTAMAYGQDLESLFNMNFAADQLFTGKKHEVMSVVVPYSSEGSSKELTPADAPVTLGLKSKQPEPPKTKSRLVTDEYSTSAVGFYCLILRDIEEAHKFLVEIQDSIEKAPAIAHVTNTEDVGGVFSDTHVALKQVTESIVSKLSSIPCKQLIRLMNKHFFGEKALSHDDLLKKIKTVSKHVREASSLGLSGEDSGSLSASSSGDAVVDSLDFLLCAFVPRLRYAGPACPMFIKAVWDSTVRCMVECAAMHSDNIPQGSEKAKDYMEYVRMFKDLFLPENCEFSMKELHFYEGVAIVDACLSMLTQDDEELQKMSRSSVAVQSKCASYLLVLRRTQGSPLLKRKKQLSPAGTPTGSPATHRRHKLFGKH